jgi:hypothetical protein
MCLGNMTAARLQPRRGNRQESAHLCTAQHSTAQHSTAQHSTTQHSTHTHGPSGRTLHMLSRHGHGADRSASTIRCHNRASPTCTTPASKTKRYRMCLAARQHVTHELPAPPARLNHHACATPDCSPVTSREVLKHAVLPVHQLSDSHAVPKAPDSQGV